MNFPTLSSLLAYGDKRAMLDRLITETEKDMQAVREIMERNDRKALDEWMHRQRSSWAVIRADKPLWNLYELLHQESECSEMELRKCVDAMLRMGTVIINLRKRKGGCRMKVFVIEDNPVYNDYVCNLLKKDSFDTMSAYNLATAKKLLAKSEVDDIVVADLRLPDGESIELLRWMRANDKQQVFIVMTNYGEVHTAVESLKLGSKDYIQKQLLEDKLIPLIRTLQKEHEKRLQWNIPIFVRQGEAYQKIKKRVRLVATTRMSVLILGENGTGKEHIAQHIHQQSKLADKPFVAVDCGALSPSLIQSAFFGHVKGAFTGAEANKTGVFSGSGWRHAVP